MSVPGGRRVGARCARRHLPAGVGEVGRGHADAATAAVAAYDEARERVRATEQSFGHGQIAGDQRRADARAGVGAELVSAELLRVTLEAERATELAQAFEVAGAL